MRIILKEKIATNSSECSIGYILTNVSNGLIDIDHVGLYIVDNSLIGFVIS
jgi:hypothetical protein